MLPWVCLDYAVETIKRIDVLAGGEHDETKRKRAADETRRRGRAEQLVRKIKRKRDWRETRAQHTG